MAEPASPTPANPTDGGLKDSPSVAWSLVSSGHGNLVGHYILYSDPTNGKPTSPKWNRIKQLEEIGPWSKIWSRFFDQTNRVSYGED